MRNKIKVFVYDVKNMVFVLNQTIDMPNGSQVLGVICNDFNEDGSVDLLVSYGSNNAVKVDMIPYDFATNTFSPSAKKSISGSFQSQPVIFQQFNDENNNLRTYVLLQVSQGTRTVYYYNVGTSAWVGAGFNTFVADPKVGNGCNEYSQVSTHMISNMKASSFVDLNSDCRPDLVLESNDGDKPYLEFYLASDNGFCLVSIQPLNADFHMASFFDVDGDGTNDLVLLQTNLVLHVFYNQYSVVQSNLCAPVTSFKVPFIGFTDTKSSKVGFDLDGRTITSLVCQDFQLDTAKFISAVIF
jgi:hypothetical protein